MRFAAALSLSLLIFSVSNANALCTISTTVPDSTTVGSIIRNPGTGTSIQTVSVPVTISCPTAQLVEFTSQNGHFTSTSNPSLIISYTAKSTGLTSVSSFVTPPTGSSYSSLGTMSSTSVSGNFVFQTSAVINLQPSSYSEQITLRVGGVSGQTQSFNISGVVPTDCSVSIGTIPDPLAVGAVLRNPNGSSILVPVSFSCNTYQARADVSASNGYFKPLSTSNPSNVQYQITMSGGALISNAPTFASSSIANNTWVTLGYLSGPNVSANLVLTPTAIANLQADTYSETIFIRVNGP